MCAYSVFNTFPVYPLSAKPLILLAFCRYRYHTSLFDRPSFREMEQLIESGKVDYVISISQKGRDPHRDSVKIRRKVVERSIPCITAIDTARVLADCLSLGEKVDDIEVVDITKI